MALEEITEKRLLNPSDAGVLLLREVERGTGLSAGLAECFRDHRDARLI